MQIVPDDSGRVNEEIDQYFTTYQVRTVVVVTRRHDSSSRVSND